jgi:hypothetical protein
MEIAPIPGIRGFAAGRTPRPDSEISPAFDINALSKMGDNPSATRVNKAAGAEENDDDLDQLEEDETGDETNSRAVSYFA